MSSGDRRVGLSWLSPYDHQLSRRRFLIGAAGVLAGGLELDDLAWPRRARASSFVGDPFKLGVASGDPLHDSVVLWTRLAPDPLSLDPNRPGGMPPDVNVAVTWEITDVDDERFSHVLQRDEAIARSELAHTLHVEVNGLAPARWYRYRFRVGDHTSSEGRTRTAPALGSLPDRLRFAVASCQHYEQGHYVAHRHLAKDDLDLVVFLGDYIYEVNFSVDPCEPTTNVGGVRRHEGPEPETLAEYRLRYAQYKTDPDLQAAHAASPWIVTWDDHELFQNWDGDDIKDPTPTFCAPRTGMTNAERAAAAFQAYYEHMPLRGFAKPKHRGPALRLYRRLGWGDLAQFHVLDTRQYRSASCPIAEFALPGEVCSAFDRDVDREDETRTMLGAQQERWLLDGLDTSRARWNVLAQGVIMARVNYGTDGPGAVYNLDQWDGYPTGRQRLLEFLARRRPSNPVVLSGDWHSNWVNDLKRDFDDPVSETVATEFAGTSITSAFPPLGRERPAKVSNPHVKFFEGERRGYLRCDLAPDLWRADFRSVDTVLVGEASICTLASFEITNGTPGAQQVTGPQDTCLVNAGTV